MVLKSRGIIVSGLSFAIIVGGLNYKISVLHDEKTQLTKTITQMSENIKDLNNQIDNLNNTIKEQDEHLQILNKELNLTLTKYDEIKKENDTLKKTTQTKQATKTKKSSVNYNISDDEKSLLEKLVYCEARGESQEGQIAVVNVILNRLNDDNFPDTVTDIICQKNQFSPVSNGVIWNVIPDDKVKQSVQKALRGEKVISDDSVYFFATWVRSNHPIRNHVEILETIGVHHFGKWI